MNSIYLDHNATGLLDPNVADQLDQDWREGFANPASQHQAGRRARHVLEEARRQITAMLGGSSAERLLFTSGGSESNFLAIAGACGPSGSNVVVSALEHPSVRSCVGWLQQRGVETRILPADRKGRWRLDALSDSIDSRTTLVSLMLANNETGVLQPVAEAAQLCRARSVLIHTDAVQAVGRIPVDFRRLGVDLLSFAAHKFHGPRGVGGLLIRGGVELQAAWFAAVAQYGLRPGTEDVVLPRGMWRALDNWRLTAASRQTFLSECREELEQTLCRELSDVLIHGSEGERLPQTTCVSFLGVDRQALLMAADLAGLAISAGSACASGSSEPSPTLQAMGLPAAEIDSAVRLSFGIFNTREELGAAAARLVQIVQKLRGK